MRVLTVVGARPQFIKCAVVSHALRHSHEEVLVHTGQHHDHGMSERFFEELNIPAPDHNLGIAGGPHGQMTGRMMEQIERVTLDAAPDWILVYGDTNSTVAAALVGAKLHVPVAHVEAGLRSFNRRMPEEVNRVVADHVSTLLLCPTANATRLLEKEGITKGVHDVGDVMYDSVLANLERARQRADAESVLSRYGVADEPFAFATIHRPENTDHPERLGAILDGLSGLGLPVVLPLHPRTKKVLDAHPDLAARVGDSIRLVPPVGYLDLLLIASASTLVLTDSGGLQKEAFFVGVRCVTLREETEWVETVEAGANVVVGAAATLIASEARKAIDAGRLKAHDGPGPFGDGHAADKIVSLLEK